MYSKLIVAKEILVKYITECEFDQDAIEYLVDSIDYLLTGKIPSSVEILSILLSDVMVASTYHKGTELLEVASLIEEVINQVRCLK